MALGPVPLSQVHRISETLTNVLGVVRASGIEGRIRVQSPHVSSPARVKRQRPRPRDERSRLTTMTCLRWSSPDRIGWQTAQSAYGRRYYSSYGALKDIPRSTLGIAPFHAETRVADHSIEQARVSARMESRFEPNTRCRETQITMPPLYSIPLLKLFGRSYR